MYGARRLPARVVFVLEASPRCRGPSSPAGAYPVRWTSPPAARFLGFRASPSTTSRPPCGDSRRGSSFDCQTPHIRLFTSGARHCASQPGSPSPYPTASRSAPCAAAESVLPQSTPPVPSEAAAAEPHQRPEDGALDPVLETSPQTPEPQKVRVKVILNERDIVEKFCRGSGKGGQKVNTTSNCVQLYHVPTGIRIRCHATRSQFDNRRIARRMLTDKLDELINGELSKNAVIRRKKQEEWLARREEWLARKLARERARQAMEQEEEGMEDSLQESDVVGVIGAETENVSRTESPNHHENVGQPALVARMELVTPGELLPAQGAPVKAGDKKLLARQAVAAHRKS